MWGKSLELIFSHGRMVLYFYTGYHKCMTNLSQFISYVVCFVDISTVRQDSSCNLYIVAFDCLNERRSSSLHM